MDSVKLYLAGDSTVQTYDNAQTKQAGWGQYIGEFFSEEISVQNHSMGGRSSKTFVQEGRLAEILREIRPNDWLLIQMGHNDANREKAERYTEPFSEFQDYLKLYINGAREKRAFPLLITPVARLHWEDGQYRNDFPEYCESMKQLGASLKVPVMDLMSAALAHFQAIGYDAALKYFMVSVNGTDYTHFTQTGAKRIAELLAKEIRDKSVGLSKYVL